jgi:hypothetical protein
MSPRPPQVPRDGPVMAARRGSDPKAPAAGAPRGGLSDAELADRKRFLELTEADEKRLESLGPLARQYADDVIEDFYRHLMSFEVGRAFFRDRALLERVKQAQRRYFVGLTNGDYGQAYVADRLEVGAVHERIGLPMTAYLGMYAFYLRAVAARIFAATSTPASEPALARLASLLKLVFFDMGLAIDTYIEQRERTIRLQQEAIGLSTPVLQVRPGLLILPIIGLIDTARAPAHRAAPALDPLEPRARRRDGRHRRAERRLEGRQSPRPDGRGLEAHGRHRDPHRPRARDRASAGRARRGPRQDAHGG